MDLDQIRNFLKLSDELHFWRTAGLMNITQSALSRQIQALEQELGVQLFERNKRNVKLTTAGMFLKEKWSVLLADLNNVHRFAVKLGQGETGKLRIAHPDSISMSLIPDLLSKVSLIYPELRIELLQLMYEDIQKSLMDYKIDLAFTRQVSLLPGITSRKIKRDHVGLFVAENHPFRTYEDLNAKDLDEQRFILPVAERTSSYYFFLLQIFSSYQISPKAVYESDFGSSIIGLVSKGLGIAILPVTFAHNGLYGVRVIELPFMTELFLSWRTDDRDPALVNLLNLVADLCPTAE
jgi:LysR family transcriptional activator of glutamate synthase operon